MTVPDISLSWSSIFSLTFKTKNSISGDKIILPKSALEQILAASSSQLVAKSNSDKSNYSTRPQNLQWRDSYQQLPHPLTFLLVNTSNGKNVYAGIQEFSAEEGEIGLSPFLLEALDISVPPSDTRQNGPRDSPIHHIMTNNSIDKQITRVEVHAKQLPKGVYLKLRPLEAGYNPDDWKSLLERFLRENFTTLTRGEKLTVRTSRSEEFRFLVDKLAPEGNGICIIDTDLEVDIEPLDEEQARETLKKIIEKTHSESSDGSSTGGDLDMWKSFEGKLINGDYVDYTLPSWNRSQGVMVEVSGEYVELLISPFSSRQRARPREDEYIWGNFGSESTKKIIIKPPDLQPEKVEALYISLHARGDSPKPYEYSLQVRPLPLSESTEESTIVTKSKESHERDDRQCKNCLQWLPKSTMLLHENFCSRNNISCSICHNVFLKKSQEWQDHWHCEQDSVFGHTLNSKKNHQEIFHTSRNCPNCSYVARNFPDLASHRTTVCPGKIILCQFCHLEVPQEGDPYDPSPEALIYDLTAHELVDGGRTTHCHLCSKIIRLRDVSTHMKHHELEKLNKTKPSICKNLNCSRTLDGIGANGEVGESNRLALTFRNELGLCNICFAPFYVNMHDPEGKALKRRIERRYLSQLISGCGKSWCRNRYCKTAQGLQLTSQTALPMVKPLIESTSLEKMYFCVDQENDKCRTIAETIANEKVYDLEWCIAASESQGNLDNARTWLSNWAPKLDNEVIKVF